MFSNVFHTYSSAGSNVARKLDLSASTSGCMPQLNVNEMVTILDDNDVVEVEDVIVDNMSAEDDRSIGTNNEVGIDICVDEIKLVPNVDMEYVPTVGMKFKWLFEQWLHCMGGQAPISILTDQDLAMKGAIKEVFPNSLHRCCNWHIFMKVPTYVGDLYKQNRAFKHMWDVWFFKSDTIEEFENRWQQMILKYPTLESIDWATTLYRDRHMWAKPYCNDTFMAGMSTTQRSESMNHFFKGWFTPHTSLSEFVAKYDEAIENQRHSEKQLDYKMNNEVEPTSTRAPLEAYLRDTFTPTIYKKYLKGEFLDYVNCSYRVNQLANGSKEYQITQLIEDGSVDGLYKEYTISYDPSSQCFSSCRCKLWEYMGILCCHQFAVLNAEHVRKLHSTYVLKRWTRHAKKGVGKKNSISHSLADSKSSLLVKKNFLQLKMKECMSEALADEDCYDDAVDALEK